MFGVAQRQGRGLLILTAVAALALSACGGGSQTPAPSATDVNPSASLPIATSSPIGNGGPILAGAADALASLTSYKFRMTQAGTESVNKLADLTRNAPSPSANGRATRYLRGQLRLHGCRKHRRLRPDPGRLDKPKRPLHAGPCLLQYSDERLQQCRLRAEERRPLRPLPGGRVGPGRTRLRLRGQGRHLERRYLDRQGWWISRQHRPHRHGQGRYHSIRDHLRPHEHQRCGQQGDCARARGGRLAGIVMVDCRSPIRSLVAVGLAFALVSAACGSPSASNPPGPTGSSPTCSGNSLTPGRLAGLDKLDSYQFSWTLTPASSASSVPWVSGTVINKGTKSYRINDPSTVQFLSLIHIS